MAHCLGVRRNAGTPVDSVCAAEAALFCRAEAALFCGAAAALFCRAEAALFWGAAAALFWGAEAALFWGAEAALSCSGGTVPSQPAVKCTSARRPRGFSLSLQPLQLSVPAAICLCVIGSTAAAWQQLFDSYSESGQPVVASESLDAIAGPQELSARCAGQPPAPSCRFDSDRCGSQAGGTVKPAGEDSLWDTAHLGNYDLRKILHNPHAHISVYNAHY